MLPQKEVIGESLILTYSLILQGFMSKMPGFEIPRHVRGFAGDADRHTLWRDRFRTAAVGETGALSLLANDVVE